MQKVKMLAIMAGPYGVSSPGDVIEVNEPAAAALIGGGFAEAVEVEQAPAGEPIEAASDAQPEDNAVTATAAAAVTPKKTKRGSK